MTAAIGMTREPLLEARDLSAHYGRVHALKPTSLTVGEGELVTVLGPNGAGKSTLLRAMTRLTPAEGSVYFKGRNITALPTHERARAGIIMVQEGRGLFGDMSVRENLVLGGYTASRDDPAEQVVGAARCKWHDDPHWPGGPFLRSRRFGCYEHGENRK